MPPASHILATLGCLTLASLGGWVASHLPVPLPWMTGSLVTVALMVAFGARVLPRGYRYPQAVRRAATATIGVAIGAQVTPELVATLPAFALSVAALLPFVAGAQIGNYAIFRRVGGYEKRLAFFAGAPGGLVEAITMGEEAGAEMQRLTAQQFLRLILVLVTLPAALSLWLGAPVGSAAGIAFDTGAARIEAPGLAAIAGLAGLGLALGYLLRLPAGQITGPLLVSALAVLTLAPWVAVPTPLLNAAQVGVGASLGLHFLGITGAMLRRALGLAVLSTAFMFALAGVAALALAGRVPLDPLTLLAAFAPGGVTEMSLVALSLGSAPAAVTLHHLIRITLTVVLMRPLARRLGVPLRPDIRPDKSESAPPGGAS